MGGDLCNFLKLLTKQEKIFGKCMKGKTFLFIMLKDFFKQKE